MKGVSDGRKKFQIGLAVLIQYGSVSASHPASHVAVAITLNAKASSLMIQQLPYSRLISDTDSLNVDCTSSDGENVLRRRVGIPVQLAPSCI